MLQQRRFGWVPEGPWLVNGKLDPAFVDWQASEWQKAYGGSIHKKRSDVLRNFKKDPANLAIAWENYRSEHLHRYENASVRMQHGLEIKPEEQQQLIAHSRAVSQPLPEDFNPVASKVAVGALIPLPAASGSQSHRRGVVDLPVEAIDHSKSPESPTEVVEVQTEKDVCVIDGIASQRDRSQVVCQSNTRREANSFEAPEQAQNPDAYRQWQPSLGARQSGLGASGEISQNRLPTTKDQTPVLVPSPQPLVPKHPVEGETVPVESFRTMLTDFSKRFAMPVKEEKPRQSEVSQLEELNRWLADPILCKEVMPRVMRSESLTIEFDDDGTPLKVVEMSL